MGIFIELAGKKYSASARKPKRWSVPFAAGGTGAYTTWKRYVSGAASTAFNTLLALLARICTATSSLLLGPEGAAVGLVGVADAGGGAGVEAGRGLSFAGGEGLGSGADVRSAGEGVPG